MAAVVKSRKDKALYKALILSLKIIPMLLALCAVLNTFLDFIGIEAQVLSFLGGISLLPLLFLYLASYVFCFCRYHRMFLHYILANNVLVYYDYYIGIPVSNRVLFAVHIMLVCVFSFLILYFHQKEKCLK